MGAEDRGGARADARCCVVLLLPMDVANRSTERPRHGGAVPGGVHDHRDHDPRVLPHFIFYYEAENPEGRNHQCWTAVKYEALTVLISPPSSRSCGLPRQGRRAAHRVRLQLDRVGAPSAAAHGLLSADDSCASPDACGLPADCGRAAPRAARLGDAGRLPDGDDQLCRWFFFVLFGGIGLAAMPMDLLVGFTKRPQPIDVQEYAKQKLLLNERAQKLLQIAGQLGDDASRARDRKTQKLCAARRAIRPRIRPRNSARTGRALRARPAQISTAPPPTATGTASSSRPSTLEKDWQKVQVAYKERGGNPLKHGFLLLGGDLGDPLLCWLIHIVLYIFIRQPAPAVPQRVLHAARQRAAAPRHRHLRDLRFYLLFCVLKGTSSSASASS